MKDLQAGVGALSDSGVLTEIRELILGHAATTMPSNDTPLDAAGAFWYRRGLEGAVSMIDEYIARSEEENA